MRTKPATPKDLTDWEWLELTPVWRKKRKLQNGSIRMEIALPESRISVNDAQVLYRLDSLGNELAILPVFPIEADVSTEVLTIVLPNWALPPASVHAVWPSNVPGGGLVNHFVEFLADESQSHGFVLLLFYFHDRQVWDDNCRRRNRAPARVRAADVFQHLTIPVVTLRSAFQVQ